MSNSVTPWTIAYQAPLSMEFSRPEYWRGWPFCFPGDLSNPGMKPGSCTLQVDSLPSEPPGKLLLHGYILYNETIISFSYYSDGVSMTYVSTVSCLLFYFFLSFSLINIMVILLGVENIQFP